MQDPAPISWKFREDLTNGSPSVEKQNKDFIHNKIINSS
jgi:predicted oxidoreductase (fatty acid repression mutant protein)